MLNSTHINGTNRPAADTFGCAAASRDTFALAGSMCQTSATAPFAMAPSAMTTSAMAGFATEPFATNGLGFVPAAAAQAAAPATFAAATGVKRTTYVISHVTGGVRKEWTLAPNGTTSHSQRERRRT